MSARDIAPGGYVRTFYGCNIYRATHGRHMGIRYEAYSPVAGRELCADTLEGMRDIIRYYHRRERAS